MGKLVVSGISKDLRNRLEEEAARNRRSVDREVCVILAAHLTVASLDDLPPPMNIGQPLTNDMLAKMKRGEVG